MKNVGIVQTNLPTTNSVRNWLTYRYCINNTDRRAHYCDPNIISRIKKTILQSVEKELDEKHLVSLNDETIQRFEETFAYRNVICRMRLIESTA